MRLWNVAAFAAVLVTPLLTGCQPLNTVYDPNPLPGHIGAAAYVDGMPEAPVDAAACDSCGGVAPWKRYTIWGRIRHAATCGSGCGEWYWGEWLYDPPPPKGCDKCDMDGNYIGKQFCPDGHCPWWERWHGGRFGSACEASCAAGDISGEVWVEDESRPAPGVNQ